MFSIFKKKKVIPHVRLTGVIGSAGRFNKGIDLAGQREACEWLEVDSKTLKGVFKSVPDRTDLSAEINENLIVELYSK